jgi:hypothetical protein
LITVASGAYLAANASASPSAQARDVCSNTARIAASWLAGSAVVLFVVMVLPFVATWRRVVAVLDS